MSELKDLFTYYGTDKARNGYHELYGKVFAPHRDWMRSVLEVGIGTMIPDAHSSMVGYAAPHYLPGGSLRAWRDYFPKAVVWGLDPQRDTQFEDVNVVTVLGNSTDADRMGVLFGGRQFDLIIDDGDHVGESQLSTLSNLWRNVAPDGFYAIEDISDDIVEEVARYVGVGAMFNEERTLMVMQRVT